MSDLNINIELLKQFEQGLDPRFPERSEIPARVLGYGEISTVLELGTGSERKLAFKKIDRSLHRLLGKDYPYVLPEKIRR